MNSFRLTALLIFQGVILIQGIIRNEEELEKGTCHLKELRVEVYLECQVKNVQINIVSKLSQNNLAHCQDDRGELLCYPSENSFYNESSGLLVFITQFNHTHHAGYRLWINATCQNHTKTRENVLLKPCEDAFPLV
ncbi:uncharacterized protein LOC134252455 [Saccostrea cucullata]|uniref:uncharacterized protein LOC134252455 n=1 Tax=Saccostrea cuccullata TaxID=36930 RepID=UPI002ED54DA4